MGLPHDLEGLLQAARAGSPEALNRLFEEVRPCLRGVAGHKLPKNCRAKCGSSDLVQEALTTAYINFPAFAGETPGQLWIWLMTILRSAGTHVLEQFTAQKRDVGREQQLPCTPLPAPQDTPSLEAMLNEVASARQLALARLPEEMRRVVELHTLEGLSYEVTAARLGRTEDAVRKLHARALLRWQELAFGPSAL